MTTKGVRDLNPYSCPASADVHDKAQSLVPEAFDMPGLRRLRSRCPRSDPLFAAGILRHCQHGQESNEEAGHGVRNESVHRNVLLQEYFRRWIARPVSTPG